MGRVAGVFDGPPGFPCIPPGVDVLEGGKLTSNNVVGSSHDPLQSFALARGAVSRPDLFYQIYFKSDYYFILFQTKFILNHQSIFRFQDFFILNFV